MKNQKIITRVEKNKFDAKIYKDGSLGYDTVDGNFNILGSVLLYDSLIDCLLDIMNQHDALVSLLSPPGGKNEDEKT